MPRSSVTSVSSLPPAVSPTEFSFPGEHENHWPNLALDLPTTNNMRAGYRFSTQALYLIKSQSDETHQKLSAHIETLRKRTTESEHMFGKDARTSRKFYQANGMKKNLTPPDRTRTKTQPRKDIKQNWLPKLSVIPSLSSTFILSSSATSPNLFIHAEEGAQSARHELNIYTLADKESSFGISQSTVLLAASPTQTSLGLKSSSSKTSIRVRVSASLQSLFRRSKKVDVKKQYKISSPVQIIIRCDSISDASTLNAGGDI